MTRSAVALDLTRPDSVPSPPRRSGIHVTAPLLRLRPGSSVPSARDAREREVRRGEAQRDRQLVALAQAGDRAAFDRLVRLYEKRAFALAVTLLRDEHDAREIVQEAFLRVYCGLGRFNGDASFFTWLYCIVKNLCIDLIRRPARRETERLSERDFELAIEAAGWARRDRHDPFLALSDSELHAVLQRCLDELPAYHRGVIVMREVQGFSYEEIAQAMGVSKGTIMSRLFHARRKLQLALRECASEYR